MSKQQHFHSYGKSHHLHLEETFKKKLFISLILTVPILLLDPMFQHLVGFEFSFSARSHALVILSVFIFYIGGIPFLSMAKDEISSRKPGMMTLISLALSIAFSYSVYEQLFGSGKGFFWELATLIDVMLLGHWLESKAVRETSSVLTELAQLLPETAELVLESGELKHVKTSDLKKGDIVLVRPGGSVPADGIVLKGESDVNEAIVTGESHPVKKKPGSKVIGGTINGDGALKIQITAVGEETAVAKIMRLVEEAQRSKTKTQLVADKFAGFLFYLAVITAVLSGIYWFFVGAESKEILDRVVAVLVIACPHALGLAIPLVVVITTSLGAKRGIIIRDRLALERAREIDTVIFDKTGTLTEGKLGVVECRISPKTDKLYVLSVVRSLEEKSEHPIAKAISKFAKEKDAKMLSVEGFSALKGLGVRGIIDGKEVFLGGFQLLRELGVKLDKDIEAFLLETSKYAYTVVFAIIDSEVIAAFALSDQIKKESREAIQELKKMDLSVAMLTGDTKGAAEKVARELGIESVFAEVLPEEKVEKIREFQTEGRVVAMVGDGINDAPALIQADVGIAVGAGTDVAIESAGIILVKSDPRDVVKVVKLARLSYKKMVSNLFWAACYNIVAIPTAAGVFSGLGILLNPALGALFMTLSTLIVSFNALLLRRAKL